MAINLTTLPSNIGGISVPDAIRGPLTALYGPGKYDRATLRYPRDLGSNSARKHSIVFTVRKSDPKQLAAVTSSLNSLVGATETADIWTDKTLTIEEKIAKTRDVAKEKGANLSSNIETVLNDISDFTTKLNRTDGDTIGLYIPDTMNVTYNSEYDDNVSLSSALGRFYFLAQGATSIANAFKDQKDRTMTNMINAAGNDPFIRDLVSGVTGKALGMDLSRLVLNAGGYAMNPQLQVLFRGIGFRSFQFDFVFTPYNKEESEMVKNIIYKFKYHSAPQIDSNAGVFSQGMYMKVPDAFNIKFYYGNEENRNVQRIGECVLENVNVDYAGSGQWSTFNDGSPNQIRLTLQFKETVIIDKNRIADGY